MSIGIERLFSIMEANLAKKQEKARTIDTEVFVISAQKNLAEERMKVIYTSKLTKQKFDFRLQKSNQNFMFRP